MIALKLTNQLTPDERFVRQIQAADRVMREHSKVLRELAK